MIVGIVEVVELPALGDVVAQGPLMGNMDPHPVMVRCIGRSKTSQGEQAVLEGTLFGVHLFKMEMVQGADGSMTYVEKT